MTLQYHVKLSPGDIAPSVLLPGDPGRVDLIASYWDEAREVARNREYVTYTGTYRGVPIFVHLDRHRGALDGDRARGARAGGCHHLRSSGNMWIAPTARTDRRRRDLRFGGALRRASRLYAPAEYPAAAHHDVVIAAIEAARTVGVPYHVGTTFSTDLFYTPHQGVAFGGYHQSWARGSFEDARRQHVLAAEMEASV